MIHVLNPINFFKKCPPVNSYSSSSSTDLRTESTFIYSLHPGWLSCQDNDCSLGWCSDFYWFTRLQVQGDHKCINCYHTDESHIDVVAKIILIVESEKGVISGHSSFETIVENYSSFPWKSWKRRSHCSSVSNSDRYHWLLILTAVLVLAFFCDWKL